ncbi:MAG: hypothetical protein WB679_04965 [Terracidiphilus sp.]
MNESTKYFELSSIRFLAKPAHKNRVRLGAATDTVLPVCGLIRESPSGVARADQAVCTFAAHARKGHKATVEVKVARIGVEVSEVAEIEGREFETLGLIRGIQGNSDD